MRVVKQSVQKGFTLVEMLVVAPIVILAIGAFLTVIISMTGQVLASRASNNLSYNVQDALNHIEQDVKMSNAFLATNAVLGDSQGYNDDTTAFTNVEGASGTSLILSMVATTTNPVSTSSSYVYLKNQPNDCSAPQNNIPFTYNVVYFIKDSTLYRRTIMPANYTDTTNTVCSIPWQQPSCSATYMDAQSGSTFCKTQDVQLVKGVDPGNFVVQYFNSGSSTVVNEPASTAPSVEDRNVALQSATTVGISINAKQTVAGQSIQRTAVLRASRLDSNASGIAIIASDSVPSAPIVSSSTSAPTNVTFNWPKVSTASGYTFEYKINSGGWTTAFSNQPTRTFTVTTATHKDVVTAHVTAINSAGNSGYGTSTVTIPLWAPLDLKSGWTNYSPPFASAGYTKTKANVIVLKGLVRAGSGTIGTLPAGYRPSKNLIFENSTNNTGGRLDVLPNGDILATVGSNAWFSLDGVAFTPSSTALTSLTLQNGWTNYDATTWQPASYALDGAGRVQLAGLIKGGTMTSGTVMATLPSGYRPPEYTHILNDATNAPTHFSIDNAGNIIAKGYDNGYVSLQQMFFPASRTTGSDCTTQWCALSFQNSWKYYGVPYAVPQYTKSSDNIVMLKGLINGGSSATAPIATLPAGFCPAEQLLLATASNGVWGRIDIVRNSDGSCYILPGAGISTAWVSLDDLRYVAEP